MQPELADLYPCPPVDPVALRFWTAHDEFFAQTDEKIKTHYRTMEVAMNALSTSCPYCSLSMPRSALIAHHLPVCSAKYTELFAGTPFTPSKRPCPEPHDSIDVDPGWCICASMKEHSGSKPKNQQSGVEFSTTE